MASFSFNSHLTLGLKMALKPIWHLVTSKDVFTIFSHMSLCKNYLDHLKIFLIAVTTPLIYLVTLATVQFGFIKDLSFVIVGGKMIIFELSSLLQK